MSFLLQALFVSVLVLTTSCSGGGGSDGGDVAPSDHEVTVSWDAPVKRENNDNLTENEIAGYVVLLISEKELPYLVEQGFASISTVEDFLSNPEISDYVRGSDIARLVEQGVSNVVLVSGGSTRSYLIEQIGADTYYFAVSAYDHDGFYSNPSETVSLAL